MTVFFFVLSAITVLVLSPYCSAAEEMTSLQQSAPATQSRGQIDSFMFQDITVTATKTDVPGKYSPFTTYSVNREDIETQPDHFRSNYGEIIRDLPGVYVNQATNKMAPWINLRGTGDFNARTLYLVDGIPVGSSIMLTNAINNNDIERVDVVMGPSSALYGSNAAGGVVNIITRKGTKGMGATVSYGYGSHNTNRPYTSVGDEVTKGGHRFNYYLSYSGDYSDGYKNAPVKNALNIYSKAPSALTTATERDADYDNTFFAGKLGWTGPNGANLALAVNYALINVNGGQNNLIYVDEGRQGIESLHFQLPISDIAKLSLNAAYQHWDRPAKTNKGISLSGTTLTFNDTKNLAQESKVERIPVEFQSDVYLGKNNILTAGFSFSDEEISAETRTWQTGALRSDSVYNTQQTAFYFQDQAFFFDRKLSVLAGLRYDHWKYYDIYDSTSAPTRPAGYSDENVTYRGGIKYQIHDQLAVRSSAGTAYYPGLPTWYFQNISTGSVWREANRNLKPEKTWMVDLGLEGQFKSVGASFTVTAYYGIIRDMFSAAYTPHPTLSGVSIIRYKNVGKAEIFGLEAQIDQVITPHLLAYMNLTLNRSRIVEDPDYKGNDLATTPGFMGSIGLKYLNPFIVNGTVALRACSNAFYDNANTRLKYYQSSPYATVDMKLWRDWKLTEKITMKTAFSIENLLDDDFAPYYIYENPGRTMQGTVAFNYAF
jgi:iron complex outermembrane receptor protein